MKARIATALALLVVCALAREVLAAERARPLYDKTFFEPAEAVVTPHLKWAKPYYRGPVRALFITHRKAMREVIELAQRMSLDYKVFAAESPTKFGETGKGVDAAWKLIRGNSAEELADSLRRDLAQRWDVIVIGNFKWDELPMDCRYLILKQVSEGTGLVGHLPKAEYEYLDRILDQAKFHWNFGVWSGAAEGIEDYFGIGEFAGSVDLVNPHAGRACVRVVGTRAERGSKESPRAGYSQGFEVEPNTRYRFSAWYRTEGFEDSGPGSISLHPVSGVSLNKTEDWAQASVEFDTGDRTSMGIYLLNYGVGTVWYDDISLTKVGDDINLVPNSGFEQPGEQTDALVSGVPFAALPAFSGHHSLEAFARNCYQVARLNEGRVAFLYGFGVPGYQMMTPAPGGSPGDNRADYDYYLALAIKAILWGAQKEPEATIECASADIAQFDRAELPGELTVQVKSQRALGSAQIRLEVHDRSTNIWHEAARDLTVREGETEAAFEIPRLPAGSYFANLWLEQGGKTVDFASAAIEVTSATHIADVTLDKDSFSCAEPVTGEIAIETPQPGGKLLLTVRDNFGRLVAQSEREAEEEVSFSLETLKPLTIMNHLRAELRSGDDLLDVREVSYPVRDLYADRAAIKHVMWVSFSHDFISPYIAREFYRHGIDTQYTGFSPIGPQQNLWHLPYATRFVDTKTDWYQLKRTRTKEDLVRSPCLTDPAYREELREKLTKTAELTARYSTSDFSLGDENHIVSGSYDLCFSPTCLADFRDWAEEQYGTTDRLNAEWGSDYESFDQVMPITLEQARETGNFAPWVDHRLHMESVWAGIHDFSRSVIRKVVPDARVGYEGSNVYVGSFHAADYWKLSHAMDLNNIYYRDFVSAAWHDFAPPGMLFGGGWYGGYAGNRNEPYMRWFPWRTLFKGANSFWVWMGYGSAGSVMAFDLSLYPFFECACEEVNEIKAGVGEMLARATRDHDGIALLYSPSSVHAATFTPGFPSMHDELNDAVKIIHDLGLECRVMSYAELTEGKLTNDEFRALLLPCAQALSEAEVRNIEAFARAGGAVIADLRPGVRDEHGRAYDAGALDELFGVRLDPDQFTAASGDLALAAEQQEVDFGGRLSLTGIAAEASVEVAGGSVLGSVGEAPAVVVHDFGSGKAMLLNFALLPYRVTSAGVSAPRSAAQGSTIEYAVAVETGNFRPASHTFHVRVSGPDGTERPHYARNLRAEDGRATGELTFALDDVPGAWKIEARDVATGVTADTTIRLNAR